MAGARQPRKVTRILRRWLYPMERRGTIFLKRLPLSTSMRWNLDVTARDFRRARVLVVSLPKCGRTWLRVFLHAYLAKSHRHELSLNEEQLHRHGIFFTHDLWAHMTSQSLRSCILATYLIPTSVRRRCRIILLTRDLRDVVVSLFFHLLKRTGTFGGSGHLSREISQMLRDPVLGIHTLVDVQNAWMQEWGEENRMSLLRYESLRQDPDRYFCLLLDAAGLTPIDECAFREALELSSFESMRRMERAGRFDVEFLQPGDPRDPESFKVRRGVIGGYHAYLDDDDLRFIDEQVARLDPRYGYSLTGPMGKEVTS